MEIVIIDNHTLEMRSITPEFEKLMYDFFSIKHPKARFLSGTYNWDGYYRKFKNRRVSRGFLHDAIRFCRQHGVPFTILDEREEEKEIDTSIITKDMVSGVTLEDYQIEAIKSTIKNENGLIIMPTGSGKTEVMVGITQLHKCNTVIFADMQVTISGIADRFKLRKVGDVGIFYSGLYESKEITICSIHSLVPQKLRKNATESQIKAYKTRLEHSKMLQSIVEMADLVLVDEADKATSDYWNKLFKKFFNGRRKYGLTATPWEKSKPLENMQLKENIGTEIFVYNDTRELEELGRITPIKDYAILVDEDNQNTKDKMRFEDAEKEFIINNPNIHKYIKGLIDSIEGKFLIIIDTHEVFEFGNVLSDILNAPFICGKTARSKRKKEIEKFESGESRVLIGSKILKRSLDLSGGTDNIIILGGGKLMSNFKQIIGRAKRINKRGYSLVFHFFFYSNYYLYQHSKSQLKSVIEEGYEVIIKSKYGHMNGKDFIKSRYRFKANID